MLQNVGIEVARVAIDSYVVHDLVEMHALELLERRVLEICVCESMVVRARQ